MLKPLEQWICDVCGEVIEKPEDGYVVWNEDRGDEYQYFGFTVIHQSRCDNDKLPNSLPVTDFLGELGLAVLISKLSAGPVINRNREHSSAGRVKDVDGFVDFFRRMQVPYYEEARRYFNDPEFLEDYYDSNEVYTYQPKVLKQIVERFGENGP